MLQKWAAKVGMVPTILTAARYLDCSTQDISEPLPGPTELCVAEFVEAFPSAHKYQLKALAFGIDACHKTIDKQDGAVKLIEVEDIEEAINSKYEYFEAMSTTELKDTIEENAGEMNLALASTLYNRLSKPNAAHKGDIAPSTVCEAQGLESGLNVVGMRESPRLSHKRKPSFSPKLDHNQPRRIDGQKEQHQ